MVIELAYGKAAIQLNLPPAAHIDSFAPRLVDQPVDRDDFLSRFIKTGGEVWASAPELLVIVNDAARHTPTATILSWLEYGFPGLMSFATFLIATGAHATPTDDQLRQIFGDHFDGISDRIIVHDAQDGSQQISVGTDRYGEECRINRHVVEADRILVIGSVEPHYFAGFTGGRKSLFPGLADLVTIERNHNLANSHEAAPLKINGNPVAEHLDEMTAMLNAEKVYAVQVVTDSHGIHSAITCGMLEEAFLEAVEHSRGLFAHRIDRPYDVLIAEMLPPLDQNLYQLQKALENTQSAVDDNGAIVLVSACEDGVGSDFFFEQAQTWNREQNRPGDGVLRFGSHKLSRVNDITRRIDVRLRSELPDQTVRQVFYEPIRDIDTFLTDRVKQAADARIAVVRDAGHTVLEVN